MTLENFFELAENNWGKLLLGLLVGGALGYLVAFSAPTQNIGRVFVSFGADWNTQGAYEAERGTELFVESLLGVLQGGNFTERVASEFGKAASCQVKTFEKGNLLLECTGASNAEEALHLAEEAFEEIEALINERNAATGSQYAIAHKSLTADLQTQDKSKAIAAGGILGVLLTYGVLLVLPKKRHWWA